ncbi:YhgE/Pip domain-containing protein [Microbacterium halophytorum]|uniref:YhgE/Pip domain-containing protein n=1 Tax=Microbacterium halophytorum TaxID=2067568 RepID=UPI000CFCB041|nr:YhgE/Pip domain-containing protein [Microbacterium halophytorum]
MRPNAWTVFRRDLGRLARVSKSWIIIIGVIVTPSLYAWFNIVAFWDPYSNTEQVSVAVVNQDEGAESDATGYIDVGGELVDQLEANDQLGWEFTGEDEAMAAVRGGDSYAAIIIPADFSRDFVSMTSGDFHQPALRYYVNEKANAIAPKITDVGASTLEAQINSTFVSTVSEVVSEELQLAGEDAEDRLGTARDSTVAELDEAVATLETARDRIGDLTGGLTDAQGRLDDTAATLTRVDGTLGDVQGAVAQAQSLADEAQQEVLSFTDEVTSAYVSGTTLIADASSEMNAAVSTLSAQLQNANVAVGTGIDDLTAVVEANGEALDELQALLDQTDPTTPAADRISAAIATLQERNDADQQMLADLKQLNTDIGDTTAAVTEAADAADAAVERAASSAGYIRDALTQSVPELNRAMSALSSSADAFSAALGAQRTQVAQAQELLRGLQTQLGGNVDALTAFDDNLAAAQGGLGTVRTDVLALGAADVWAQLSTISGLEPDQIADFMASPVEVSQHVLFPTDTYGSAMAPLFTNLSLWIGAFVLMVIMRLEVDTEGVEGISVGQAYMGRWLLFAAIAVFQAVLVTVGNLVIGVQTASAVAFVGTAVLIGLAYLSIIYALSVCFGHVGKGLCILLVIFQIPGASGLYPIEMMPDFFQSLYPFLPFTYGIDALRETVSGFDGGHYWQAMGTLGVFVVLAFVLGLFLRRRLGNFALLFNRGLAESELMVNEDLQVIGRRRTPDIIRALTDGDGFRAEVARRTRRFTERYPSVLRLTLIIGAAGLVVLGAIAWLVPEAKAVVLGLFALWSLIVIAVLVALEYLEQSIGQAAAVGRMPESELRGALAAEASRDTLVLPVMGAAAPASASAGAAPTVVLDPSLVDPEDDDFAALQDLFDPDVAEDARADGSDGTAEPASGRDDAAEADPDGNEGEGRA